MTASLAPLQLDSAQALVTSFLTDAPQGPRFAQLPTGDVAQVLVLFDRLERDPALQQSLAAVNDRQQLVDLATQAGAPISLAAAEVMAEGVELLDDDQLDQVTGGSLIAAAIAGAGLAASVLYLGSAVFTWMASRNDLETAKINAGVTTA